MSVTRRLSRAVQIARAQGFRALLRATGRFVMKRISNATPDECAMVYRALDARAHSGTMVDVGAHIGTSLMPFARAGWRVLALEPDRVNRGKLADATKSLPSVVIDPRAVSDHAEADVTFFRSELSDGISGLSAFHHSHRASERVTLVTLETILKEYAVDQIDFLKIDTEGFDLLVLKGVPWKKLAPDVIVCEFEDSKTIPLGYSYRDLAGLLVANGYAVIVSEWFPIVKYGSDHKWRRFVEYPCDIAERGAWGNLIASRDRSVHGRLRQECARYRARS